jgi:hypothetical protein
VAVVSAVVAAVVAAAGSAAATVSLAVDLAATFSCAEAAGAEVATLCVFAAELLLFDDARGLSPLLRLARLAADIVSPCALLCESRL